MIDRKRQRGYAFRSIRRARSYLDEVKRQYINPNYNRSVDYKKRAKDEIKYIMDTLTTYFT